MIKHFLSFTCYAAKKLVKYSTPQVFQSGPLWPRCIEGTQDQGNWCYPKYIFTPYQPVAFVQTQKWHQMNECWIPSPYLIDPVHHSSKVLDFTYSSQQDSLFTPEALMVGLSSVAAITTAIFLCGHVCRESSVLPPPLTCTTVLHFQWMG